MLECLKEEGFQLLNEQVIIDYIKYLETKGYVLTNIEPDSLMTYLIYSNGEDECHVLTLDTSSTEWVTFELYDGPIKREQVEFMKDLDNNKVTVYYSAHFTEGTKEKVVVSGYDIDYGEINISWAQRREIDVEDFNTIYEKDMDLKQLIKRADARGIKYHSSEDTKDAKVLKLSY